MASAVSNVALLSKFRGCMIGGLIGDCMGDPFENEMGVSYASKSKLTGFFNDALSEESKKQMDYTDDTCMSVSIAKSLVENKAVDLKDMARKFVREYDTDEKNRNYGCHVGQVFRSLKSSGYHDVFLPARKQFNGSGSYGNGAPMRIAPIALFGINKTDDFLKDAAKEISCITHAHAFGYNGAILQSFSVLAALKLDSTKELDPIQFISDLEDKMKTIQPKGDAAPYLESLKQMKDIYLQKEEDSTTAAEIAELLGNLVTAHRSMPAALYSFLRGLKPISDYESDNPFIRTIYFAISLGGDTDTIGAMAGNIAGAYHGIEAIPEVLIKRCEKHEEIDELAQELYKVSVDKP